MCKNMAFQLAGHARYSGWKVQEIQILLVATLLRFMQQTVLIHGLLAQAVCLLHRTAMARKGFRR
jgi:hypothetical protein